MSTATMSTSNEFILLNSKGKQIEDLFDIQIDTDISNQPYDYSSPVKEETFAFPPRPKLRRQTKECSILGKRKRSEYDDDDDEDDDRYGQHIGTDFFSINVGHGVLPKDDSWDEYIRQEGKRERDSESKYDPEEILNWSYNYLAQKNKM